MMIIGRIFIKIRSREDIPLPSVSSRISKLILIKALESIENEKARKIAELFKSKSPLNRLPVKPVRVSFIYDEKRGRMLWEEYDKRPIMKSGNVYTFTVTIFESDNVRSRLESSPSLDVVIDLLDRFSGEFKVFKFNTVEVYTSDIEIVSEDIFEDDVDYDTVTINFLTPTFLQYPHHPKLRNYPTRHALYPQPMLVLLSLVYKWNNLADSSASISSALYAPYEIIEINHSIRPVTIQFRKVRERGFVGWIKYGIDSKSSKRFREYIKLLKFANYSGIGRSTNIGLGEVRVCFSKRS